MSNFSHLVNASSNPNNVTDTFGQWAKRTKLVMFLGVGGTLSIRSIRVILVNLKSASHARRRRQTAISFECGLKRGDWLA